VNPDEERSNLDVVLVAAECKGLAKVGGLADVIADLSRGLVEAGVKTRIIMPRYDSVVTEWKPRGDLRVEFAGQEYQVDLGTTMCGPVEVWLVGQRWFFGGERYSGVYVDSSRYRKGPFEDDSRRFAFFCNAVARLLDSHPDFSDVNLAHCHDWHTGTLPVLVRLTDAYTRLARRLGFLFTIHNLDYQGVRPLKSGAGGSPESPEGWFGEWYRQMLYHPRFADIRDPAHEHCYNPMRAGMRLCDRVNTVSPGYAEEITRPDDSEANFVGGRGLEDDLRYLAADGRLSGILNGIYYDEHSPALLDPPYSAETENWRDEKTQHKQAVYSLLQSDPPEPATFKLPSATEFMDRPLAVAVTRMADQKVSLLLDGGVNSVLQRVCRLPVTVVILGTGELEQPLLERAGRVEGGNCGVYLRFDNSLARTLYAGADLFLMPSDFEPCGISQMVAMSYGTLPIVSAVGGLKDTVEHEVTGFVFSGDDRGQTANNFVDTTTGAVELFQSEPTRAQSMQKAAMTRRFTWTRAAADYVDLYQTILRSRS
jgi:starch synthase